MPRPSSDPPLPVPPSVPPNPPALETPQLSAAATRQAQYERATHLLSLALLVACPAIAALPPRKLDFYTFSLAGAWVLSANHLVRERRGPGRTAAGREGGLEEKAGGWGVDMPTERAREVQRVMKERRERALREGMEAGAGAGEGADKKGLLEKVWMGGEKEGWKERRLQEEREAEADGRGYGSMIMDQVMEVWNGKSGALEKGEDAERKE